MFGLHVLFIINVRITGYGEGRSSICSIKSVTHQSNPYPPSCPASMSLSLSESLSESGVGGASTCLAGVTVVLILSRSTDIANPHFSPFALKRNGISCQYFIKYPITLNNATLHHITLNQNLKLLKKKRGNI